MWSFPVWPKPSSFTLNAAFLLLIDCSLSEHVLIRAQAKRASHKKALLLTLVGLAEKLVVPYLCWSFSYSCLQTHSLWNTLWVCTYLLPFSQHLGKDTQNVCSLLCMVCVLILTLGFPLRRLIFRIQIPYQVTGHFQWRISPENVPTKTWSVSANRPRVCI